MAYRQTPSKGVEGSPGASAECVSEHKLSQRQDNNSPGMHRPAERARGEKEHRSGEIPEEARLESHQ